MRVGAGMVAYRELFSEQVEHGPAPGPVLRTVLQQNDVRGAFVQTGADRLRALGVEERFQLLQLRQVRPLKILGRPERHVLRLDGFDRGPALDGNLLHLFESVFSLLVAGRQRSSGKERLAGRFLDGVDLGRAEAQAAKLSDDVRGDFETPSLLGDAVGDLLGRHALAAHALNIFHAQAGVFFAGLSRRARRRLRVVLGRRGVRVWPVRALFLPIGRRQRP